MTKEIAGAIVLLLRAKCKHVRAKPLGTNLPLLDEYTVECLLKLAKHECTTDCFLFAHGLCPLGITKEQLRTDQLKKLGVHV